MNTELINKLKDSKSEEDRRQCIPLLQRYLEANPNDANAWYDLAGCFDFCGFEKDAEPCYWKAYELGWQQLPQNEQPGFFVGFGSTLRNNLKFAESEKILKEAITHFPDYPALKVFLAFTLHSQGKLKDSTDILFQSTLQMPVKSYDGFEKAIQWYVQNLETHPTPTPTTHYEIDGVKIRTAIPHDAPELANVHLSSWREAYKGQLDQEFLDWMPFTFKRRKQHWEEKLSHRDDTVFVAEGKSGIVGFISLDAPAREQNLQDWGEVGAIYLLARYKGKKIGLHLLKTGFASLRKKGFDKAYCWMLKGNPTGQFYESTGAKLNGREKIQAINSKDETEVMYVWESLEI